MAYDDDYPPDKVAAVIKFSKGTTVAEVREWVQKLKDRNIVDEAEVNEYHSPHGSPVWYIP